MDTTNLPAGAGAADDLYPQKVVAASSTAVAVSIIERAYAEAQGQLGTPGADLTIDATTGVRCYQSQTTLGS